MRCGVEQKCFILSIRKMIWTRDGTKKMFSNGRGAKGSTGLLEASAGERTPGSSSWIYFDACTGLCWCSRFSEDFLFLHLLFSWR
jgi:hypothetical protein